MTLRCSANSFFVFRFVTSTNLHPVMVEVAGFAESSGLCEGMPDQRKQAFTKVSRQGDSVNVTEFSHLDSVGNASMLMMQRTDRDLQTDLQSQPVNDSPAATLTVIRRVLLGQTVLCCFIRAIHTCAIRTHDGRRQRHSRSPARCRSCPATGCAKDKRKNATTCRDEQGSFRFVRRVSSYTAITSGW